MQCNHKATESCQFNSPFHMAVLVDILTRNINWIQNNKDTWSCVGCWCCGWWSQFSSLKNGNVALRNIWFFTVASLIYEANTHNERALICYTSAPIFQHTSLTLSIGNGSVWTLLIYFRGGWLYHNARPDVLTKCTRSHAHYSAQHKVIEVEQKSYS